MPPFDRSRHRQSARYPLAAFAAFVAGVGFDLGRIARWDKVTATPCLGRVRATIAETHAALDRDQRTLHRDPQRAKARGAKASPFDATTVFERAPASTP